MVKTLTPKERIEQENASLQVLHENANSDHHFEFEGLDLVIYKDVFSPHYFNGWRTFTPALRKRVAKGMDFLEVGVGSGITALLLAKDGVNVSASDISPLAVENTKANAQKNKIKLERVLLSDVYDGFKAQYKFDAIYWNAPWMETLTTEHDKIDDILEYGLFDNGFSCLERFIQQTPLYLKPQGKLYMGHADFGDYERLESLLDKYGYKHEVIADEQSLEIRDVEFYLYEAQLKEKPNQIFVSIPDVNFENSDLQSKKAHYCQLAEKHGLKVLESSFEVNKTYDNIAKDMQKAQVLLVDLSKDSIKTGFEIAHACRERCIPIIGFGFIDGGSPNPFIESNCTKLVNSVEEALEDSLNYCRLSKDV